MKYEPHLNWDLQYKKLIKARASAYNECIELYRDIYTPPELKLRIFMSKEELTDKYGCEVTTMSAEQKKNIDTMQMKHLKNVVMCHQGSRNSLLRMMTDVHTYETIRMIHTIGLLKKIKSQKCHRGPLKLLWNWEDRFATWIPDGKGWRVITSVNVTNDDFRRTNCRQVWADHWRDVYDATKNAVKRKWVAVETKELVTKLKGAVDLSAGTRAYKKLKKGTDPLIGNLSSVKLSQFLNLVNGGHPLYWKKLRCPWCNENSNACHILDECNTHNAATSIGIVLDTSTPINE